MAARCPGPDIDLWDIGGEAIADGSPLAEMYNALKTIDQISYVRASKLLACKRPRLVPVRDTVVEDLLNAKTEWWGPMKEVVSDQSVRETIDRLSPDPVSESVSLLRRLDVILWMEGKRHRATR